MSLNYAEFDGILELSTYLVADLSRGKFRRLSRSGLKLARLTHSSPAKVTEGQSSGSLLLSVYSPLLDALSVLRQLESGKMASPKLGMLQKLQKQGNLKETMKDNKRTHNKAQYPPCLCLVPEPSPTSSAPPVPNFPQLQLVHVINRDTFHKDRIRPFCPR
ncbi:hypothetical protein BDP55DRAFT_639282 [Colletotrichum godetiae]|uniref:Uncharacterized protein n=1 Tax=Colletotrichum godetiae TaxID=1209918 RepID=A0AAJ0A5E7_9PEZI|nr:uncharacterized protein BDP55DRAFT_639282 [Colletotrichum godetiae]KAK1656826.1 hypothetical protein BDP55DRAFT_639282 [Colletotrichum godetiae]